MAQKLLVPKDTCIDLLPHQRLACNFIKQHPYCGLFLPTGCGKTATTLEALYELNPDHNVLILGPKPVMRATWADEIEKWQMPLRVESLIVNERGKQLVAKKRHEKYETILDGDPAIYFLNYELTSDLVENLPKLGRRRVWPFPTVIIDEAQAFKTPKSKRFKDLKKVRPFMERVIELTGTPAPNGFIDLWSLIYLLDMGQRLGQYVTEYRQRWFYPTGYDDKGHPYGWTPLIGSEAAISQQISDITMSIDTIGGIMPPVTINDIKVQLSNDERKLYKEMVKEKVLVFLEQQTENGDVELVMKETEEDIDDTGKEEPTQNIDENGNPVIEHEAIAVNAAVLSAKLSQMASGSIYIDGSNKDYVTIHERKLDACQNIVENAGSPVIIAYHFKSDADMLMKRFEKLKIQAEMLDGSPEMIHRWNDGEIPVLLLQPASSGHGLNLQHGGYTLVWYTLPWSLEHYIQTNARLVRQGQNNHVIIHRLMCEGTIDSKIKNALEKKDMSQSMLLDAVKKTVDKAI